MAYTAFTPDGDEYYNFPFVQEVADHTDHDRIVVDNVITVDADNATGHLVLKADKTADTNFLQCHETSEDVEVLAVSAGGIVQSRGVSVLKPESYAMNAFEVKRHMNDQTVNTDVKVDTTGKLVATTAEVTTLGAVNLETTGDTALCNEGLVVETTFIDANRDTYLTEDAYFGTKGVGSGSVMDVKSDKIVAKKPVLLEDITESEGGIALLDQAVLGFKPYYNGQPIASDIYRFGRHEDIGDLSHDNDGILMRKTHGGAKHSVAMCPDPTDPNILVLSVKTNDSDYLRFERRAPNETEDADEYMFRVTHDGNIESGQLTNMNFKLTDVDTRLVGAETNVYNAQTTIVDHTATLGTHTGNISTINATLDEGPVELASGNKKVTLNVDADEPGLLIKCDMATNVPYIKCETEAGVAKFQVLADGTVMHHAILGNNHADLPDGLNAALATGNDSVYIGQAKISYSDSAGYKFYKLKDNTVPTVLAASPFSLTTSHIDAGKNNNTLLRWLDLARPSHSSANLRISDIVPLSNLAADFEEVTIGGSSGASTKTWKILDDLGNYNSSGRLVITLANLEEWGWNLLITGHTSMPNQSAYITLPEFGASEVGKELQIINGTDESLKVRAHTDQYRVIIANTDSNNKKINYNVEQTIPKQYCRVTYIYLGNVTTPLFSTATDVIYSKTHYVGVNTH